MELLEAMDNNEEDYPLTDDAKAQYGGNDIKKRGSKAPNKR